MKPSAKQRWLMGCAALLLGAVGLAADTTPAALPVAEKPLRDPFSPLAGPAKPAVTNLVAAPPLAVTPGVKVVPTEDPAVALRAALRVQGFLQQGERRYAMVNGRLVSTGDVLQVRSGAQVKRFRVREVNRTTVEFDPLP